MHAFNISWLLGFMSGACLVGIIVLSFKLWKESRTRK